MAADRGHPDGNKGTSGGHGAVHLLTPAAELAALREPTGVDLVDRHQLNRYYESESRRTLKKGFSHFLSPQLQVLIKEKPRIALSEKADFGELLAEEPSASPWPIQELSVELLRRSFLIRKIVAVAGVAANADEGEEGPPVPPDVPMANQTTNKFSPAYAKKVHRYDQGCITCTSGGSALLRRQHPATTAKRYPRLMGFLLSALVYKSIGGVDVQQRYRPSLLGVQAPMYIAPYLQFLTETMHGGSVSVFRTTTAGQTSHEAAEAFKRR